jgi:hypothetical protein
MPSLSSCRFSSALAYVRECHHHPDSDRLTPDEQAARRDFIAMCRELAEEAKGLDLDALDGLGPENSITIDLGTNLPDLHRLTM